MAIEDAINRLAAAVERNQQGAAVAEIIRQRDLWQKEAERNARACKYEDDRANQNWAELEAAKRRINALRGTITRMKRAARKGREA